MKFFLSLALLVSFLWMGCRKVVTPSTPTPSPTPTPTAVPKIIGAGFRYSTYGPSYDPGPQYWANVGQSMASKFSNAKPQAIWIVGDFYGTGTFLSFPGTTTDPNIFSSFVDMNEEALTLFDQLGIQVWLQVEPGDASMEELIRLMLENYGHHVCVIGVGVDVEWFHSDGSPEGQAVTDEEAAAWVVLVRSYNPQYRLFLKHWEVEKMPPTVRDGILFVDDSQQVASLDELVSVFTAWGQAFAPAPVGFQYGYLSDKQWWSQLQDPPKEIGQQLLERVPNTEALFWVDFTVLDVFPPEK